MTYLQYDGILVYWVGIKWLEINFHNSRVPQGFYPVNGFVKGSLLVSVLSARKKEKKTVHFDH